MSRIARVTLRYTGARAKVISVELIDGPVPISYFAPSGSSTGAWITVTDPQGLEVFHQPLPDPFIGGEIRDVDGTMRRVKSSPRRRYASVETPWPGSGSEIAVHARRSMPKSTKRTKAPPGTRMRQAMVSGSEIARVPLNPDRPLKLKRPSRTRLRSRAPMMLGESSTFPVKIDDRWGHDNPHALNLVFMPEGFSAQELDRFHAQVDEVLKLFEQTEPFSVLIRALKVSRIEIPSEISVIGDKAGRTFFRGRFTTGGIARVIEIDQEIAAKTINDHCKGSSARGMVVVNSLTYGGSGGAAAAFSCVPTWSAHIAMHELGHSHFMLADEYGDAGQAATMDPVEPNVCADHRRDQLKWAHLVKDDTPLPTWRLGDPIPTMERIGAFEGGKYRASGIWRPALDCKMRRVDTLTFCAVCAEVITRELERRLQQ